MGQWNNGTMGNGTMGQWVMGQWDNGTMGNGTMGNGTMVLYLAPWSRVLPEKLTGPQLVKNFSTFYGTRMFIAALTSARHLSIHLLVAISQCEERHISTLRYYTDISRLLLG
jgi:hypothetical protein